MAANGNVDESDVGILCYISNLPGFRGILKQRYADFIVNEVDLDGNVIHLTSLEASPEVVDERETKLSDELSRNFESEIESFRVLAGDSNAELLKDLIDKITSRSEDSISPIILSPSSDKPHRTAVHNYFKEKLKFLVTDTVDEPDASTKCIRVRVNAGGQSKDNSSRKRKERGDKSFDSRGTTSWPDNVGKFLRFHLYKENKETQEAVGLLGKMLGIQVTVFKQSAGRLAALNDKLFGIKLGDFCYVKEGLLLGQLLGNRFTVVLRDVIADYEDSIGAAANALAKFGFVNYFGLQRFGSSSVPTHLVGAALLRGEWTIALGMILGPRKGENDITKAREYYKESGDIEGTLRQLPRHLVAERAILQCLKKHPGNQLQALKAVPRTLRMMYVHSYQSYLWNHAASLRVKKHGANQVVVGDLVHCQGDKAPDVVRADSCEYGNDASGDVGDMLDEASGMDLPVGGNSPVKGKGILFWNFVETDLDIIAKSKPLVSVEPKGVPNGNADEKSSGFQSICEDGGHAPTDASEDPSSNITTATKIALKLGLTLPSSCYATMAIRELLKTSTLVAFHKALNH